MDIKAPMSGNVWKVLVKEADVVKAGQTLIILESMKMEIPVETEEDGKVEKVFVSEGDFVQEDSSLLILKLC
ncbi:biotin/lipoyl-binding carrier protein [Bacillus sp. M6-12]|uniref:biotin/lipoyl-binding carrier protein n=1 Tax=Bacillus sp. M6-12 TaxID=2054166 RepID=UPI0015E143E4